MKKSAITFLTILFGTASYANAQTNTQVPAANEEYKASDNETYKSGDSQAQLQQARENVKVDEQNVKKAETKKRDNEAQVDIDKASIKKYDAQLQEDKAQVKRLEEKTGDNNKKE